MDKDRLHREAILLLVGWGFGSFEGTVEGKGFWMNVWHHYCDSLGYDRLRINFFDEEFSKARGIIGASSPKECREGTPHILLRIRKQLECIVARDRIDSLLLEYLYEVA